MTPGQTTPQTVSGQLAGGITGSQPIAQKQDIQGQAVNLMNLAASPI